MSRDANEVSIEVLDVAAPAWGASFRSVCLRLLRAAEVAGAEVSILLTGDERMRALNRRYRRVDRSTDVLSFAQGERREGARVPLGDIVISLPALRRGATRYRVSEEEEARRLVAHGLLHLLGWDHRSGPERRRMAAREEALAAEAAGRRRGK